MPRCPGALANKDFPILGSLNQDCTASHKRDQGFISPWFPGTKVLEILEIRFPCQEIPPSWKEYVEEKE